MSVPDLIKELDNSTENSDSSNHRKGQIAEALILTQRRFGEIKFFGVSRALIESLKQIQLDDAVALYAINQITGALVGVVGQIPDTEYEDTLDFLMGLLKDTHGDID